MLALVCSNMHHCKLIGLLFGNCINNIKCEVEALGVLEGNTLENAAAVFNRLNEAFPDAFLSCFTGGGDGRHSSALGLNFFVGSENNGVKLAVSAIGGNHTVRSGGVIINSVTGAENLCMVTKLNLKIAADDNVAFLTFMGSDIYGAKLSIGGELTLNIQGLGNTVAETVSHIVIGHSVSLLNALSLALSGESIAAESRSGTFYKLGNVNAKSLCAHIEECEIQILFAGLICQILVKRNADFFGHILFAISKYGAQLLNTACNFQNFELQSICCLHRTNLPADYWEK